MAFLPKSEIAKYGKILFRDKYDEKYLKGESAAYRLTLGNEAFLSGAEVPQYLEKSSDFITIKPGQFALLMTYETIFVPNHLLGFITIRYSYKKLGLINVSGFHVDPGYEGKLVFSVFHAGPSDIIFRFRDDLFMIFFAKVEPSADYIAGEHQHHGQERLRASDMLAVTGAAVSLSEANLRLKALESRLTMYGWLISSVLLALFLLLLRLLLK